MKRARLWLALVLLAPALTVAQEKYTNKDLKNIPAIRDAYTNADLARLAPVPMQERPIAAPEPMPRIQLTTAERDQLDRNAWREDLYLRRDLVEAEIAYWEGVIHTASTGLTSSTNQYPQFGPDVAEAYQRIAILRRLVHMVDVEISLVR